MSLVLEIEYLSGVSFAARGPDTELPDWPPQPDRVFSALVATWAAHGEAADEAAALRWLEAQDSPRVLAAAAVPRTAPPVFVPPNDASSERKKSEQDVLPATRRRQPRRFPAARPRDPCVRLVWPGAAPDPGTVHALERLAFDTAYVGHSSSLTRCRFFVDSEAAGAPVGADFMRWVYPGRLNELSQAFSIGRRPSPGAPIAVRRERKESSLGVYDWRWLLLEHVEGAMPDLLASAVVAKTIRDALLSGYRRSGLGDAVPVVVSGHDADGKPAITPHMAIIPLAHAGFAHADGHVLGFALVPPRGSGILEDPAFKRALAAVAPANPDSGRRHLTLWQRNGARNGELFSVTLSPTLEPARRSLVPDLYLGPARTFGTVTPLVLDRHLKKRGADRLLEIEEQVVAACAHVGFPAPVRVVSQKHSAMEGAPSVHGSSRPPWQRWRVPGTLTTRTLTHAVIEFAQPVSGPLLLGAGRYVGLGLCRPLEEVAS